MVKLPMVPLVKLRTHGYIGSVLFRASALTGAKFASGVPVVIGPSRVQFRSFELTLCAGPPLADKY